MSKVFSLRGIKQTSRFRAPVFENDPSDAGLCGSDCRADSGHGTPRPTEAPEPRRPQANLGGPKRSKKDQERLALSNTMRFNEDLLSPSAIPSGATTPDKPYDEQQDNRTNRRVDD
jgi:hypothetical protein